MNLRIITLFFGLTTLFVSGNAQTSINEIIENPDKAGGIYYAYPEKEISSPTKPPKGFKPFYISHFGRHGSRYLISDDDYTRVINVLYQADKNSALTAKGKDLLARLDTIWEEARGRGGELTPLGHRQHNGIARRMIKNYPEVFTDNADIFARSTVVMRCAHSMNSFCEGLKEINPRLKIRRESSQRHMDYLNYHTQEANHFTRKDGPWAETARKFENSCTNPDRIISELFNSPEYVYANVNPEQFMWDLYWITVDLQNMETNIRLNDILNPEELFKLWQAFSWRFYATNCNIPLADGLLTACAKPSLRNILECAQKAIANGKPGADLRFAHDGNLIPLAALLGLQGCDAAVSNPADLYKSYADFKISPMAGNIQMILFKNKSGEILVKFLLNEREIAIPALNPVTFPFYSWQDVENHFKSLAY